MTQVNIPPLDEEATELETLTFLMHLLEYVNPQMIVEAGTYKGHFALIASAICPRSWIWTSDIHNWGFESQRNITYFQEDFEVMLDKCIVPPQFAFIDSGPARGVLVEDKAVRWRHYKAACRVMPKGSLVVVHDMIQCHWDHGEEIKQEASLYLHAGRGMTIKQL